MAEQESKSIDVLSDLTAALQEPAHGRIFTLMGPNGAGKSRLLESIEKTLNAKKISALRLPANRSLTPITANEAPVKEEDSITLSAIFRRQVDFGKAIFWEIASIIKSVPHRDNKSKEQIFAWYKGGKKGQEPTLPIDQLSQLQTLVERLLKYQTKIEMVQEPAPPPKSAPRPQVGVHRGIPDPQPVVYPAQRPELIFSGKSSTFKWAGLSDGEKQILLLAWMLVENRASKFIFLVDEPELYLNESRAVEFWEEIEGYFPEAVFLHATHNIVFATRPKVSRTFLMGMDSKIEILMPETPLPYTIVREMVGARVQILRSSNPIVFCEDILLRSVASALLPKDKYELVLLAGHETVVAAARNEDKSWAKIRSAFLNCGIIDRDSRDDDDVRNLESRNIFCFPLFEAESLLLIPEVATRLLSKKTNREVTVEEFKAVLIEAASEARDRTLLSISAHLSRRYVDIKYSLGDTSVTNVAVTPPVDLEEKFKVRAGKVYEALANKDVEQIVKLFDGKELCSRFASRSQAAFGVDYVAHPESDFEFLARTFDIYDIFANIPYLADWPKKIKKHLSPI